MPQFDDAVCVNSYTFLCKSTELLADLYENKLIVVLYMCTDSVMSSWFVWEISHFEMAYLYGFSW